LALYDALEPGGRTAGGGGGALTADLVTVREAIDAFNRRELAAGQRFFDPDVEWEFSGYLLQEQGHMVTGRDELVRFGELMFDTLEESRIEVDEVTSVAPNKVVCSGRLAVRAKGGDTDVIAPWVRLFELRDGRILRSKMYPDREAAIEAASES
jgi:ketosteroid isomerase-like protein